MHEAPRELSGHRGIDIPADQVESKVLTKECKGEATQWRNDSACTHTNPMQLVSDCEV